MKKFLLVLGPVLFLILVSIPTGLTLPQQHLAAVMALVVCWWLGGSVPLPVTGLLGVSLATILGISNFEGALRGFANPVIFLFMGGFFLARAMHVHELDLWIARKALSFKFVGGHPVRILIAISLLAAFLSSFLSNTATTAMFVPIALSLFTHLNVDEDHPSFILLLMVAYAATIGGITTPLGSPPNVIALSFLDKLGGIQIGFLDWVLKMLPLTLFTLGGLFLVFWRELKLLPAPVSTEVVAAPALTSAQKRLSFILLSAVFLWILPGVFQLILGAEHELSIFLQKRLPEAVVAILMSSFLFIFPRSPGVALLTWNEARDIDWGTLLLFGSGISLGLMMFDTGLATLLGEALPFDRMPFAFSLLLIAGITLFATELVSNTATANLLIPLALTTSPFKENPMVPVLAIALSSNMAFMLPVGTPPNAIVFGTGKVKLSWMMSKGIQLNIICLMGIWVWGLIFT